MINSLVLILACSASGQYCGKGGYGYGYGGYATTYSYAPTYSYAAPTYIEKTVFVPSVPPDQYYSSIVGATLRQEQQLAKEQALQQQIGQMSKIIERLEQKLATPSPQPATVVQYVPVAQPAQPVQASLQSPTQMPSIQAPPPIYPSDQAPPPPIIQQPRVPTKSPPYPTKTYPAGIPTLPAKSSPGPIPSNLLFETSTSAPEEVATILTNQCARCHSGTKPKGGFQMFDSFGRLLAFNGSDAQKIFDQVDSGAMPQDGALSDYETTKIEEWLMGTNSANLASR